MADRRLIQSDSVRRRELLAVLTPEWQSTTSLRRFTGNRAVASLLLPTLLAEGVVERRGRGCVGSPYEWRLVAEARCG